MSGETLITVVGNLTADPELRFTPSGAAVANFTVASTPRTFDKSAQEWKDGRFTRAHPLADAAGNRCDASSHPKRGRLSAVACGECWEQTIRDDALAGAA